MLGNGKVELCQDQVGLENEMGMGRMNNLRTIIVANEYWYFGINIRTLLLLLELAKARQSILNAIILSILKVPKSPN